YAPTMSITALGVIGLLARQRPRPDHLHVSFQIVLQLRHLIEAGAAEEATDGRYARVVAYLEGQPILFVEGKESRLADFRVGDHRAELIHDKRLPAAAAAPLPEDDRSRRRKLDCEGHDCKQRQEQ